MNPTQTIRRTVRRPVGVMGFLPALLLATSGFLLLTPSTVAVAQYKTERAPFNDFLNYGRKKLKPGRELENEIIKSKVEVLGEILKHHVQRLRQVPNQRIELVFLVDSSASVGAENFFNELKFVKKLLADFAVSYNQTRVAVITFSSKNKVIRHIDHVTQASENNHKCSLLELELPRIKYSGGGTYTLGAMLEAQSVIALARQDAAKAVFLVTDGYSNGGDPRPAADFLQARGVTIFTFGIRNGNVKELYDMASVPKEEHSYILDSFEEFEALARRALHEDLHSGVLMAQDPRSCLQLCSTGDYCCDAYATCTCGTHTGHYACTCRKGYYGTGLHGDCRPCPAGTYKDKQGPGDVSSCIQCPDVQMMSSTGSTSPQQCYCKRGYNQVGMKCVMLQCPVLAPPENGYFVRNTCNNVVNAACGVRCNPGFTLKGSSIRLCGEDGVWSGGDTQCVMKSCPELKPTAHGTMVCSQPQPTMDTECHFACDPGYQLVGSKMRTCLPVAMWDGIPAYCKPIFCPTLAPLRHGKVRPASCATSKSKYGTRCEFACDHGYQLSGPIKSTCVDPGVWSGGQKPPRCIDVTPPVIQCPHNQTVTTDQYESYAKVTWDPPFVKDNSKEEVRLTTIPATTQPMKLNIGSHTITYVAKDKMGNKATCKFSITVFDEEPPRVDWCDSPPIFLSHDEDVDVYWEEPIFSDNSGKEVQVMRSMEPGRFPQGDTMVEYMAVDEAGNMASCNITITVQKHACQLPVDPINGAANCTENPEAVFCTLICDDGYAFAMRPRQDYFCAYDGVWLPEDNPMPFPDCSVTSVSNSISQAGEMAMEDDGSICDNIFLMGQVENQLEKKLEEALNTMCDEDVVCEVAAVEAVCESILAEAEEEFNSIDFYRRRRSTKKDPLAYFWPGEDHKTGDSNWVYWKRGEDAATNKMQRVKRDTVLQKFNDFEEKERHKRQFGFSFDDLFGTKVTTEAPKQPQKKVEDNYLGVLIDLISRSMASDIGLVRFGSFLNTLQSQNGDFTSEDFLSAFAKEFGEDKAEALRELAVKNLSAMKISGLTGTDHARNRSDGQHSVFTHSSGAEEHTWMTGDTGSQSSQSENSEDSRSSSYNEGSTSYDYDLSHSSQVGDGFTKKAFKVRFRVEGHGSGATDQLQGAMGGLLDAAATGQLDMNFGKRQLRVAAIRLREYPEYLCEAGSIPRNNKCVKCPVGTFFNVVLRDCLPCPQGSFQPEEGQVSCLVCPTNTSTKAGYAKSDQDCKAQCLPGSYSEDGLEPCTTCDLGHYQDEYTSTSCADCPHRTTTWRRGSWVIEECKPKCAAGQVSETGLEPCFDCPIGFIQEEDGQTQCFRCPGGANTHQTGTTSIYECQGVTQGDQAAYTNLQALDINDCFSVPCLNQGSCTPMDFGYVCLCPAGYTGQQCESEVDECESEPCYNNGTCLDMLDNFHCDCPPGFSGSQCEVDINECDPDPCMNGATCVDIVDAFKCICHSGYTGEVCDRDIDECAGNPCAAGATCQDLLNDYACVCPPGDTGRFCEVHINECESSPCAHGLCLDLINEFSCVCEPGYTGETCEVDVDDCATQPCINGATCTDWINGFSCTCRPGFTGKVCDTEMLTDFVMEFPSSGILDYVSLEGFTQPLTAASVCFWMHSNDRENYGTPFSYATDDHDNAFTVTDYNGFVVYVNGDKRITDVRGNDGLWHFICVTWASQNGTWAVYLDGELRDRGTGLAAGSAIEGSGTLVLGQEQDHRGGSYSPQESFIGEMTHVNFWDEVLSQAYIETTFSRCDRYVGTVIGWPDFQAGIKGHVTVKSSTFCRGCGVPSVPPDGSIQQSGTDPGAKVTISCDRGFKLYRGDDERTCLIYGIWSGDEPECRRVSCGFPGYLLNGHVEGNSYSYGDTVSYTCNPGFFLVGNTERTCQADGEWNGERPQCEVIKCPDLSAGPHGEVMSLLGNYMPTNQISFRCEEGYQMDGPNTLTCGGDGQWDGHPPSCQSETCGELPSITNGYVEGGPLVLPGEQVVVKCDFGFKLVGDALVTCKDDSTWSRPLPKCIKPKCSKPPPVDHGSVKVRASLSSREAVYKCDVGYVLVGSKTLSCGPEGEWDGPWSACEGLPCPNLQAPPHASITQKDVWRVGDNVTYECELGYELHGEASRICVIDGSEGIWQGDTPECRAITCPVPTKLQNGAVSVVNRPPASPDSSDGSLIIFPQTAEEESSDGLFIFPHVDSETELRRRRSLDDFPDISFPRVGVSDDDYEDYHDYSQSTDQVSEDYEDFDIFSQNTNQVSREYEDFGQSVNSIDDFGQSSNGWDDSSQSSQGLEIFGQSSSIYGQTSQTSESYGGFEQGIQVVEQGDYLYGTEVEYDCRPGFKLLGAHRRRCSERGEWDVPEPRCYEQYCPDLDSLPNAHIIYHGSGVNSRAEYVCDEGFKLVSQDYELLCQSDKAWLGDIPSCQVIDCGEPPEIGNGTVDATYTTFGSLATYNCFFGYVLEGSVNRYCSSLGNWNGSMPRCIAVTCNVPPVIDDGYITFEGSLYVDSPIEYECKECFKLNGTRIRNCQVDGTWTLEEPECNLIYCDELPTSIPNGRVIGDDNSCGSLVEYECSPGYHLNGKQKATCLETERWSSLAPTCERVSCGLPPSLANGKYIGTSFEFTDKITYECNEGYMLQGPNLQVCQADGTWSDSPPYCAIVNCTKPRGPSNGKVRLSGLFFGSYASVECEPGFKMDGEDKLMCDASGNWNVEMPHCLPVICPNAPQPPHTTYNSSELQFEAFTILKYECDVGYYTTTQNTLLMCSTLGEWEGEVVQCLPVDCGDPGTLPNGYISGRDYTYGNTVWFTCDEGFKLLGAATAECQADGSWSNYATSCLQITCPEPQQFEFGRIVMEDESGVFGASLVYQCNVGYILSGSANRTCDISGVWTGDTPQCQPVTCPEPFEALNSVRMGDVFQYDRSILYSCNEGYSMKGSAELLCQADGSWSNEVPICEMITCPEIPEIEHGSWDVKSFGEYPIKTEPSTAKAKSEQNIFAKLQTLYQGEAKEGLVHKYEDVVEFQCDLGYAMASTGVLECTEDGWNASVPQCHPISCPIPIQIRHGSIIGNDYTFGATIHYECDEGRELVGESTRTCQESKEWTDTEPFCRIIECPRPAPLDNGQTIGESINYRSILSYICDAGFRLEGDDTRTCQSNGHWTGEQPVCVELFCDLPEEIVHGVRKINSLKVGGTVRYTCMEGYRMEGSPTLNCISEGIWDVAIPKCIQVDCGPPPTGDNIVIQGSHTVYSSQVTFTCERGYQLNGAEWSTCMQSGHWSNDAPLCDPIFCSPPPAPAHGSLLQDEEEEDSSPETEEEAELIQLWRGPGHKKKGKKKNGKKRKNKGPETLDRMLEKSYRVDDMVSWVCNEGFQAEGAVSATCTEEGQWSSAPPRCRRVSCGSPELPDYAQIQNVDFLYGSRANYSCREGYNLEGMSILTCEANGDWSSEPPSCVPVSCGPPKPTLHTLIRIITPEHNNPHGFGATASYSCADGYQLQGGEYQVCEANGEWFGDDHVCLEMVCEDTPALANGLVVKDDAARPQIATFSCQPGYNLQGNNSVLCSFGRWLEVNTTCEPVNCFEPEVPPFGKITAKHFSLGSVANYSCMYGYMLVGNPSVECDIDATWKGGLPTCQPVDCGSPEAPSHGNVESTFSDLGSKVLYHCDKGYQLFGNDSRVCTSNATWSGNLPQCHRKDCGEIKAPQNGFAMGVGTLYGDRVKFACERGHVLRGEVQVLCEDTGSWSSATPRCEPVICSLPPLPPNTIQQPVRSSLWVFQDRIQYYCQEGYLMRGDLSTTCLETGTWSRVRGQCAKISCGRPKINRDGAVVLGRSFYYKDKVIYRCPPGKVANGSGVLTCMADGSWSGIPSCVGQCGRRCLNGGVCLSKNACTCPPGYVGDHCQHAVCVASCLNGGTCVAPYKCRCLHGFVGARCQTPLCPLPCLHGGICTGPHRCTCLPGYAGSRCQTPVCEQGCGKGGRCIGPNVCHCSRGHTGPTCDDDDYDYNYYGGQMDNSQDATRFDDWDIVALRRRYRRRH